MEPTKGERKVYILVLTGGPCGGKTTGQSRLCTFFENIGWQVFRVPETASVLLRDGPRPWLLISLDPTPLDRRDYTLGHLITEMKSLVYATKIDTRDALPYHILNAAADHSLEGIIVRYNFTRSMYKCANKCIELGVFNFQQNLLRTMLQIENTFFELAKTCKRSCLIICDRGAMDPAAFLPKEMWDNIMKENNWNSVELRDTRYNHIVHMVSAAVGAEDFYSTEDHACRSESVSLARDLDQRAAAAWVGHPYFDVIDNSTDFEGKIRRMIDTVCQKVGIDTGDRLQSNSRKLKFLVAGPLPEDSVFPPFQDFEVVHNYLQSEPPNQVRLRKRGQKGHFSYIHTVRRPVKLGQVIEVKTQLTHRDYINLLAQKDSSHFTIYKKRRCFLVNNQYFQLDIYQSPSHPRCKGLMLLETYTTLTDDCLQERLPSFLNIEKGVTGNPHYSMFNLSLREDWKNSKLFCSLNVFAETISNGNGHAEGLDQRETIKMNGHARDAHNHIIVNSNS